MLVEASPFPQAGARPDHLLLRLRGGLLARIARHYRVVEDALTVGTLTVAFTRIADPDEVLDRVAQEEDVRERLAGRPKDQPRPEPLHLPYWAELWESSLGLAVWLTSQPDRARGRRVLDLGCGMGLAGTVAAALGANVLLADLEPPALLLAALNSLPWRQRVRARRVDWRTDKLGERFDIILGADILYERSQWEALDQFWRQHVTPAGTILLGEPGRQTGELFIPWAKERGWRMELFDQAVPKRPRPIRVIQLQP
jgi:predicted nicotinamide N-methyase